MEIIVVTYALTKKNIIVLLVFMSRVLVTNATTIPQCIRIKKCPM